MKKHVIISCLKPPIRMTSFEHQVVLLLHVMRNSTERKRETKRNWFRIWDQNDEVLHHFFIHHNVDKREGWRHRRTTVTDIFEKRKARSRWGGRAGVTAFHHRTSRLTRALPATKSKMRSIMSETTKSRAMTLRIITRNWKRNETKRRWNRKSEIVNWTTLKERRFLQKSHSN